MSFIFPTSTARVQEFAGALWGRQLGSITMASLNRDIANNGEKATFNTAFTNKFGALTSTEVAELLLTNLGITTNGFVAVNYIVGQLNAKDKSVWGETVSAMLTRFSNMTTDGLFGAAATAWVQKLEAAIAYTGATDVAVGVAVSTFLLTASADQAVDRLLATLNQPVFA